MRAMLLLLCFASASEAQIVRLTIPLDGGPVERGIDPRATLEMGAVVLTGVGHLAASEVGVSNLYVPVVIAGWGGYVGARALSEPGFLADLGFTGEHLGRAARDVGLVSLGAAAGMAAYGAQRGSLRVEPSLVPLLVLYPVWGLTQQMLVQGFLTRHLDAAGLPALAVAPLSAAAFGSVHVPNWPLTAATTALGGAFAPLYLRDGTLWPLGVAHGALGALFYAWVLDRDAWAEFTGRE
jgi:membrane protease YdiL (CAAX protease family)